MLAMLLKAHSNTLNQLHSAQQNPFYSVDYLMQARQQLILKLHAYDSEILQVTLSAAQLLQALRELNTGEVLASTLAEACLVTLLMSPKKLTHECVAQLNENDEKELPVRQLLVEKLAIYRGRTQTAYAQTFDALKPIYFSQSAQHAELFKAFKQAAIELPTTKALFKTTNDFAELNLINSPLMSAYLLLLDQQRVNHVCNFASQALSREEALQVMLHTGMPKYVPLVVSLLSDVEDAEPLINGIKRCLGAELDNLVTYETQVQAQTDAQAIVDFQHQFNQHWPEHESYYVGKTLVYGYALNQPIDRVKQQGVDQQSWQVLAILNALKMDSKNYQESVH